MKLFNPLINSESDVRTTLKKDKVRETKRLRERDKTINSYNMLSSFHASSC